MFSGFLPLILLGLFWTISVSAASLIFGLVGGALLALGELSPRKIISVPTFILTGIFRGLPEIVVLFFCYFGGAIILTKIWGHYVGINAFIAGTISLGMIFAAYAAQVFRGAFYQIPEGQFAAAYAIGLSKSQTLRTIILPQIIHHAKPGLGNLWISLLKDSSLVSLLGLADVMNNINLAASQTHQPFLFYSTAAIIYLILTTLSKLCFERKTRWI